jgi:RNA polymerase sigma factor (sigma-70 family)
MQNAAAVAWRYFPRLRDDNQFTGLLFEIIRQQYITRVRTETRRLPMGGDLADPIGEVEEGVHSEIESELDLREALSRVDRKAREAVLLSLAGFSQNELCKLYGCSRSCMNMRIIRARETIKHHMREGNKSIVRRKPQVGSVELEILRLVDWANKKLSWDGMRDD